MLRLLSLAAFCALATFGQNDPAFDRIPFDRWITGADQAHFLWNAQVSGGFLTATQRLGARVDVTVDGNELAKRRGPGQLVVFIQLSDADHRTFQTHGVIELNNATEETGKSIIGYRQRAFVAPGDYRIDIVMLDTSSGEHAALQRSLHIAPLKSDPLPDSMLALPGVEFAILDQGPDLWYQPQLKGRLHLPLALPRPLHVQVLMNASPSSTGPRFLTGELNRQNQADLIPAFKVFSQIELSTGSLSMSVIDVTRRQVLFGQEQVDANTPLDWSKLQPALNEVDPHLVNVRDLADGHANPQFFVEQVRGHLGAGSPLIVLSSPMTFLQGDDRRPIQLEGPTPGRVYYIRFHPEPVRVESVVFPRRRRGGLGPPPSVFTAQEPLDSLEPLLKPLHPRVFDVYSPEQFRKALADVMKDLGRL
jgi:hypothetical protein